MYCFSRVMRTVLVLILACGVPSWAFLPAPSAAPAPPLRMLSNAAPRSTISAMQPVVQRTARRRSCPLQLSAALEVIEPSYNLAIGVAVVGSVFGVYDLRNPRLSMYSLPGVMLGLMLCYQTAFHRYVFDDTSFGLVRTEHPFSSEVSQAQRGGKRWSYEHFANYDFFPSYKLPILVYIKETQSPPEQWNEGPGKTANSEEALSRGAKPGQVHFFPAFADVEQMQAAFDQHRCQKMYHYSD